MSDFLINLARRGAGLAGGQTNARPSAREFQASAENLEQDQDQIVETSKPVAFEPERQPAFERTPATRTQTLPLSQEPHESQESKVAQAVLTPGPDRLIQRTPDRLIQRTPDPSNQTANPLALTRTEPPAPSEVDQKSASDAGIASRKVVRQFDSPVTERPSSSSSATVRSLPKNVVVAMPRSSANEQAPMIDLHGSRESSRPILSEADNALEIVLAETQEYASEGKRQRERQPERDQLDVVTLTPRLPAIESHRLTSLPNVAAAASVDVASMPIHVRIAKVEVRAAPATAPATAPRVGPAPIGFGSYYRLRNYRS